MANSTDSLRRWVALFCLTVSFGMLVWGETLLERYLEGRRLRLHHGKTEIVSADVPAPFLGFVLLPGGGRRLPEDNVMRFRNRLRGLRDRWRAGTVMSAEIDICRSTFAKTSALSSACPIAGPSGPTAWRTRATS